MSRFIASVLGATALALGSISLPSPANAGFLDQLFGGLGSQPAPQAPVFDAPPPAYYQEVPVRPRAKRRVARDEKPKLQKPTDLMHDATLRPGDAVMMNSGIKIYTGDDDEGRHSKTDFERLDAVDGLPKQERKALVAIDASRNDPLQSGGPTAGTLASGRSAAVATPIVKGREIVDAKGRTVRYVGP